MQISYLKSRQSISSATRLCQSRVTLITQFSIHRVQLHMIISDLKSRQLLGFPIAELQIVMREYFIAQKQSWTASVAGTCLKLGVNITEYFK